MNSLYKDIILFISKISGYTLYFWTVMLVFGRYVCWKRFTISLSVFLFSLSVLKVKTNKNK